MTLVEITLKVRIQRVVEIPDNVEKTDESIKEHIKQFYSGNNLMLAAIEEYDYFVENIKWRRVGLQK